jgi:hypothetical protein
VWTKVSDGPDLFGDRDDIGQDLVDDGQKRVDALRLINEDDRQRCLIGPMPHRGLMLMTSTEPLERDKNGAPRHSSSDSSAEEFVDLGSSVADMWLGDVEGELHGLAFDPLARLLPIAVHDRATTTAINAISTISM